MIKILLAGDGGQGIQTIADVICRTTFEKGLNVTHIPNYGLEQRGGVSLAFIQISDKEIVYPKFTKPDILLVMSEQADERTTQYRYEEIKILDIKNYKQMLSEKNIKSQNYNIFFLGVLAKILEDKKICSTEEIFKLLEKKLSLKPNWEEGRQAFEIGEGLALWGIARLRCARNDSDQS